MLRGKNLTNPQHWIVCLEASNDGIMAGQVIADTGLWWSCDTTARCTSEVHYLLQILIQDIKVIAALLWRSYDTAQCTSATTKGWTLADHLMIVFHYAHLSQCPIAEVGKREIRNIIVLLVYYDGEIHSCLKIDEFLKNLKAFKLKALKNSKI